MRVIANEGRWRTKGDDDNENDDDNDGDGERVVMMRMMTIMGLWGKRVVTIIRIIMGVMAMRVTAKKG